MGSFNINSMGSGLEILWAADNKAAPTIYYSAPYPTILWAQAAPTIYYSDAYYSSAFPPAIMNVTYRMGV